MSTTTSAQTQPSSTPSTDFVTFGAVHLDITDAEQALAFWRDRVGLQLRGEQGGALHLGTDTHTLLVLHPGATSPVRPGHAGLYHLAIHLPIEGEFARVVAGLFARRTLMSPTDHVFS